MATIGDIIDRCLREYLTRPQDLPASARLISSVSAGATSFVIVDAELTPEEEALINPGSVIEIDRELMRVVDYDDVTNTLTVTRGYLGTTDVAHTGGPVIVSPPWPRQAVFDALGDLIVGLYPSLWRITTKLVLTEGIVDLEDATAKSIISVVDALTGDRVQGCNLLPNFPDVNSQVAVTFPRESWGIDAYITYRQRFLRPTAETDDLTSGLGIDDSWQEILIVGTVARLGPGVELEHSTVEYITEALEAQGVRLGEITNVTTALIRYKELLLRQARLALTQDNEVYVSTRSVL
jgi:hypothetical protein